jgi:outer membrane protein insertion porin family
MLKRFRFLAAIAITLSAPAVSAQETGGVQPSSPGATNPTTVCGLPIPAPKALPPANSGPVVFQIVPCFEAQGNETLVEPATYLYYIHLQSSRPSEEIWVPWTDASEATVREDFNRLMGTNFLDDLSIETSDYVFPNGVVGKLVIYRMEERQRVKIVDYVGSDALESTKIDEKLRELNTQIRMDTFIDAALVKKVEGIIRDMMKEKGFQYATVKHEVKALEGGPKLVHLTFNMDEGPKVKIRRIVFEGNRAFTDSTLGGRMKGNKPVWFLSFISGRGTYQENKFEEDAERVLEYYRDRGYINAQVGDPTLNTLDDSSDEETRWVEMVVPVIEGNRYRVGNFTFDGNTVIKTEVLRPFFKIKQGDFYSQKRIREGVQKAQELYGSGGYFEFVGYPDNEPRDMPKPADPDAPPAPAAIVEKPSGPPIVDVTMRMQEGKQYFVNRITFVGNTTTRDSVIRRELRLYENGVFNTEALKFSVRRLNQLGYFKALQGPPTDVTFEKTAGMDGKVDVQFKLEEQNRNQLTFGAGVSQFEGFFGQLSFQTANFLGRGESLTLSLQGGQRAQNYALAFTEPFLFDRNITGGINIFKNEVRYISQFTQETTGGALTFGFPLGTGFTRMYTNYSYEEVRVTEISDLYNDPLVLATNPWLRDSLLIGQGGQRTVSKFTPTVIHNTVDQPIFPTSGRRLTASIDIAGVGGNTSFLKPRMEAVWFLRQNTRMSLGMRALWEYVRPYRDTIELPIFERLFLGGEYSVRGFDTRTIGPQDPTTGLVLGGNKSLLFNIEQNFTIAGQVRFILFYDAGQVQSGPQRQEDGSLRPGRAFVLRDFKTSTGAEVRFFMPVLNVPFRLIFAQNLQRDGVLDNSLRPQKAFQFRFAVGTTF